MELRMQYATTADGVRIAFGTAGSGPWIVRAPSLPFTHSQLEWAEGSEFFDQVAANWSVAQFDPRGIGLSDRDVDDFSMEKRLLDLEAVVGKLGLERFVLHGVSWAGPLAVTYAIRHPERISHLVLDDTQARTKDFMNVPQVRALDQLTSEWDSFLEYLVFMIYGLGRGQAESRIRYFRACVTQEVARLVFEQVASDDVTDLLPQVSMPTLIVQHAGVSAQHVQSARELAALVPDARLVMLSGLPSDDNEKIVRAIGDLLGTETTLSAGSRDHQRSEESGVRTILFTDIVEHTAMMGRLGDKAGRDVLREHETLTRDVLRSHGGAEIKTMGDGFMASFSSPTGAVECAIALQRAFEELHHGPGADAGREPIHIRIGLNAGEPIEEGGDLFGATVIMASRIAAHAKGSEILASDVVRGLCSGKGFLFADRGENVLRGFEDAVRLYEINWRSV
jgi:class 3 adenylate cyclase/pimeloyl-ACP methyl ester carboxylesterase